MKKTYITPSTIIANLAPKSIILGSYLSTDEAPADHSPALAKRQFGSFEIYEYNEEDMQ